LRHAIEKQIAEADLQGEVILQGPRPWDEVRAWLAAADCLVLPSVVTRRGKQEGIPVALMEALAMKVPVVATNISGIPELIEHKKTGLLVPPEDAGALVSALLRIHDEPAWAGALGDAGHERVAKEYDLGRNVAQLDELFRSVCAREEHRRHG